MRAMKKIELRVHQLELRASENPNVLKVSGYVNKTNQLSDVLGTTKRFVEKIAKGAFSRAIKTAKDIDFLAEHDASKILASTRNNSLKLYEDEQGLWMEAEIVPTSWGKDYFELINSGVLQHMSFGFRTMSDSWRALANGLYERTIDELELFEVSAVKTPAYSQSTISARGIKVVEEVKIPTNLLIKEERKNYMKTVHNYVSAYNKQVDETRSNEMAAFNSYLKGEERALQTVGAGQSVIPTSVADLIVEMLTETSQIFAQAKKFPSVAGSLRIPKETTTSVGAFVGEGENLLEDAISLGHVDLQQKRVGCAISLTNQLINDSAMNMAEYIPSLLAKNTYKAIEKSMLRGSSVDEFKGIVPDSSVQSILLPLDTPEKDIIDFLLDIYLAVSPEFHQGAMFIMSRPFFNKVSKLKDSNGHFYVQNGVVNGKPTQTLFGAQISVTDSLESGNEVGHTPVVFGNLNAGYALMIKKEMQIQDVQDTQQALRGSHFFVLDAYMDASVYNEEALAKLVMA
jgi:HK97 family phage major capsid protein/HK97 family phage prohead protease